MNITKEQITEVIHESLDELNEQLSDDRQFAKAPGTVLLSDTAGLDSLGFVNFVAIFEEKFESRLKRNPGLSGSTDSFETVQDLVDLVHSKLSK